VSAGASPARRVALAVVRRTFEDGAYADRALRAEARRAGLEGRELAFATRLAFGAVQRRATLDHLLERFAGRPPERLDAPLLGALRVGLFELCWLDGADHAAVDQAVELAKAAGGSRGGHGLVNAVMRRAAREARPVLADLDDGTPEGAALAHSHPEWIARLWWMELGPGHARALMAADNEPAETAIRVNALVATSEELRAELASAPLPAPGPDGRPLPEGIVLDGRFDVAGSALFARGALTPQSRASMAVARLLDPRPGERVLDLCAAPGAKTTHVAALMGDKGEVVAVERHPGRARALRETCARMRATCVEIRAADARDDHGDGYDRVLLDPPCSGLGTLRGRPDLRWRASPGAVAELAALQGDLLDAAARALRPGGTLVYSTCTISPDENQRAVAALVERRPDLAADDLRSDYPLWEHPAVGTHLLSLPHRDATDGFFIARLRRAS
jgi:16S rRNA (cytosine967-C5)-methyltransferase